jgi:hypothetical protein
VVVFLDADFFAEQLMKAYCECQQYESAQGDMDIYGIGDNRSTLVDWTKSVMMSVEPIPHSLMVSITGLS